MKEKDNNISRRRFLRHLGIGAVAGIATACGGKVVTGSDKKKEPDGKMTYRLNHNTGDSVSVLGYGCMRLPTVADTKDDTDPEIDQEAVNAQVDYALEHGVNYFDTSPAYCKGRSEHVMGIALSRHPRDSYFIATKLSNFAPSTWPREESIAMFKNSLKELPTD